jgi:hypothetical protein
LTIIYVCTFRLWTLIDDYHIPIDLVFDLDETSALVKKNIRQILVVAKGMIPNQPPANQIFASTLVLCVFIFLCHISFCRF